MLVMPDPLQDLLALICRFYSQMKELPPLCMLEWQIPKVKIATVSVLCWVEMRRFLLSEKNILSGYKIILISLRHFISHDRTTDLK